MISILEITFNYRIHCLLVIERYDNLLIGSELSFENYSKLYINIIRTTVLQ